ncbi:MAG: FG-GAP-like repeat-containing protein [Flavobacteriales bacterium]|jgi:REP element-mobilizing transposase RayT|nr:FG-GAP-like repeat-containing protein [Flavobacteriales bacterium]
MSEIHKANVEEATYFVTLTVDGWVDVFTRKELVAELVRNVQYCQEHKGLELFAYVIMPNHVHFVMSRADGLLADLLRDFKSCTTKQLLHLIATPPDESHPDRMLWTFNSARKTNARDKDTFGFRSIIAMRYLTLLLFVSSCALHAQFGPQVNISHSASAPTCIVVADLNDDGLNDLLVSAYSNDQVAWYPGLGAGVFGEQQLIAQDLLGASRCEAVDLDGDGDLDVLASAKDGNKIVWYRNDGAGFFGPERVLSTAAIGPSSVQSADLDGDGLPDVVATCSGGSITWYRNLGNGQFGEEVTIVSGLNNPLMTATGDLDGDGDLDLVVAEAGNNVVKWYPNAGDGTFGTQTVAGYLTMYASYVSAVDINGDGTLDLLVGCGGDNKIKWFTNDGTGTFNAAGTLIADDPNTYLRGVYAADLDGDGDLDVVAGASSPNYVISWYANNGTGLFGPQQVISTTLGNPATVMAGDLDNDGDMDVVASGHAADLLVYYANNGSGQFGSAYTVGASETSNVYMSFCADINGDGTLDVVAVSSGDGKLSWYPNTGAGTFGAQQVVAVSSGMKFALSVDVDGDGDLDLISMAGLYDLGLSINNGNGQFSPRVAIPGAELMFSLAAGDVDGDGDMDLLLGYMDEDGLKIALNNGSGSFTMPLYDDYTSNQPQCMSLFDVDGDGDLDVLMGNQFDDVYQWFPNDGSGQFGAAQDIAPAIGTVKRIIWADMDGDGIKDMLTSTESPDKIAWYRNLGNGSFGSPIDIGPLGTPRGLAVADLDGDGDLDVVAASWFDNVVAYYLNDGSGLFSGQHVIGDLLYSPIYVDVGDLDQDGDPDVVVSSNLDDRVVWYENYIGSPFRMEGRLYHDLNGDGLADAGEPGAMWASVQSLPQSSTALSDTLGHFIIFADSGAYQVHPVLPNGFWQVSSTPPYQEALLTGSQPVAFGLDLGIMPAVDTSVIVTSLQDMIGPCGSTAQQYVVMANMGTRVEHGRLTVDLDSLFAFNGAEPTPDLVQGHHLEWNFTDLGYEEVRTYVLNVTRPGAEFYGDELNSSVNVLREDEFNAVTDTFSYAWSYDHLCSYDPNDKLVDPKGTGPLGIIALDMDHLDYTIRFQNTGNAPAYDVVLRDQLDPALLQDAVQVLGYSHAPSRISIEPGGELVVEFRGIALPDSGANRADSQGFFSFRVGVVPGQPNATIIANQAAIYFDLNTPVITNNRVSTLLDCSLYTATITDLGNGLLEASPGNGFQWSFNGSAIPGATQSALLATETGYYSVSVTGPFGCENESDPFYLSATGIAEVDPGHGVIFPNPVHDKAVLYVTHVLDVHTLIEVVDVQGRTLLTMAGNGERTLPLDASSLAPGIYMVRVLDTTGMKYVGRFVVE